MDAVKFAFETTLVGLLALPWLALLLNFFLTRSQIRHLAETHVLSTLRDPTVMSIVIITAAYFMGSAILPIATQLLDDQDMPIRKISEIRADINELHLSWFDAKSSWSGSSTPLEAAATRFRLACNTEGVTAGTWWRPSDKVKTCWQSATDLFLMQQQLVLEEGAGRIDRISRLYEQVIVLRGAVLNTFLFASLSWFAYFSASTHHSLRALKAFVMRPSEARSSKRPVRSSGFELFHLFMGLALVSLLLFVSVEIGVPDIFSHTVTDPPIMESVLFVLALIGLWGLAKGVEGGAYPFVTLMFSLALMFLAFGAWQWTEVLYTENIIAAFFARG
jgi:hypothetical protein